MISDDQCAGLLCVVTPLHQSDGQSVSSVIISITRGDVINYHQLPPILIIKLDIKLSLCLSVCRVPLHSTIVRQGIFMWSSCLTRQILPSDLRLRYHPA